MCVYGGGVREVSGYIGLTSLTSPIGHCVVAATECSCTVAMEPAVYRVGPNGCAAIGGWGAAQFSLWSDTAQWQWPVAPMGIGVGATLSAAMGLGWLGEFKWWSVQIGAAIPNWHSSPMGIGWPQIGVVLWGLGPCTSQWLGCHCQNAMVSGPNGYRVAPMVCAAMGLWGAAQSSGWCATVKLPNCNGPWPQWV